MGGLAGWRSHHPAMPFCPTFGQAKVGKELNNAITKRKQTDMFFGIAPKNQRSMRKKMLRFFHKPTHGEPYVTGWSPACQSPLAGQIPTALIFTDSNLPEYRHPVAVKRGAQQKFLIAGVIYLSVKK